MKKKFFALIMIVAAATALFASPSHYIKADYLFAYDTNVYSYPLLKYASPAWLEWRAENPYQHRLSNGMHLEYDLFFSPDSVAGISFSSEVGLPCKATDIIPEGDFNGYWEYVSHDVSENVSVRAFFGLGPLFRRSFGDLELGVSIRLSLGSFDYSADEVVMGLMAEPFLNYHFDNGLFLSAAIHYDGHMMSFYTDGRENVFRKDYSMVSIGGYIGMGMSFGDTGRQE